MIIPASLSVDGIQMTAVYTLMKALNSLEMHI